ncbi:recombinase family protein [Listeria monocytogenes]|nr:recombinase family protein [Listeria monocytogenes]EAC5453242.1 recombinase family protein [Listeria monocytogenes]EAC5460003.1 recombinase family protein [Listeria monocytogenes]EAC5490857.1 recombinase family protein [Listeria monocytogenes]EAC9666682.1 recombinase family protein [Listeria monocytogenes]
MSNMVYGYARVSTRQQDLSRQLDLLERYECHKIYTEKISGIRTNRPELNKLKKRVKENDKIIIESFSRLGRSTKDLIDLVYFFERKGVKVISIKENFDTQTPQGKLMMTVFQAFSQFERDIIVERTKEGLDSARARGNIGGRPRIDPKLIQYALNLYQKEGRTIVDICAQTGIKRSTFYRYLRLENDNLLS